MDSDNQGNRLKWKSEPDFKDLSYNYKISNKENRGKRNNTVNKNSHYVQVRFTGLIYEVLTMCRSIIKMTLS